MNTKRTRRRFTKEFKHEAIHLVEDRDSSVSEIASNLGISPALLYRWIREHENDQDYTFPGNGKLKAPDEKIGRLENQVKDLQEEREILKKALTIFSKKPE